MIRATSSSQLFRLDHLRGIQHFFEEIEAIHKSIDRVEKEVASVEKRIRWLKKVEAKRLGRR